MKKLLTILSALLLFQSVSAQKVGLVLSGGGARGVAHVGVIKALEENEIPIDYVVGTSMGAIVGSLYCMGYTPDEMLELISSEKFRKWYEGAPDRTYRYFFMQNDPTPAIATMTIDLSDTLIIRPQSTSLVNPQQMNLGFVDIFAGANAVCSSDFDKLMVPFRSVGSDVTAKRRVVMSDGDLGNAVRASMTFPFVFKPIRINGSVVYDGGIYDNYPYDVMVEEFAPDIIIGSVVSGSEPTPDEEDLYGQLRTMIIQDKEIDMPSELGISINTRMYDIKLLDYNRSDDIMRRGYRSAQRRMNAIKSRVEGRRTLDEVNARRNDFKSGIPEMLFHSVEITGVDSLQANYLERSFRQENKSSKTFDYEELQAGYFKLMSDNVVKEIIPSTSYSPADSSYTLGMDVTLGNKPQLHIGGGLSTSATSQLYAGLSYNYLRSHSIKSLLEGQVGRTYNNAQLTVRFDLTRKMTKSFILKTGFNNFNYYNQKYIFNESDNPAFNKENEFFVKLKAVIPLLNDSKAEVIIGGDIIKDYYLGNEKDLSHFKYNVSHYNVLGASVRFLTNNLNTKQYPTSGFMSLIQGDACTSDEFIKLRDYKQETYRGSNSWLQLTATLDHYSRLSKKIVLGNYLKLYYSSRSFSDNYYATMMQAGRFEPTPNSVFVYNNSLRSNQYLAYGIKPMFVFNRYLHLRSEFYGMLPFTPIYCDSNGKAYHGEILSQLSFLGEISLVATYSRISANLFVNIAGDTYKFDSPSFGITLGILMPGERFFE